MNKYENAVEQLKSGIKTYIDKKTIEIPCDRTFTALVTKINSNGTYEILLNGVKYNNIKTIGGTCYMNETVKVLVPQNNYNNMFILKAIESIGNYKLFDYTNDKSIKIVSNDAPDRIWNKTQMKNATRDPNKKDCYFYIDNEYYVDDREEYLHTGNIKAKGACFSDRSMDIIAGEEKYGYFTSELKYMKFIGKVQRTAGRFYKKNDEYPYGDDWYIGFLGGRVICYRIDNFEKGQTKYLGGEYITENDYPNDIAKPDYSTNSGWWWNNNWGDSWATEKYNGWGGYFTSNLPIFSNDEDAYAYISGTEEEAKEALKKAINYKPTKYQEIFTTSFLMNENAKVKVDVECNLDYNEKNYDLEENEKQKIVLNVGQDYGHGFFKIDERPLKKIKYEVEDILYNTYHEQMTDYVITMSSTDDSYESGSFREENTNNCIYIRVSTLIKKPQTPIAETNHYVDYMKTYGDSFAIYFNVYHSFLYCINFDGTYTRFQEEDRHEVHKIFFSIDKISEGYATFLSVGNQNGLNFYRKNGTMFPLKNTFIKNYPVFFSPFSDNFIYEGDTVVGKILSDDTVSLASFMVLSSIGTNMRDSIKKDGKLFQYNTDKNKDFHKVTQNFIVQYYINDTLVATQPSGTFDYGGNILRLMRTITSETGGLQKLSIRLGLIDGEVEINPNDILVTISGAGLIDQTHFSGDIEIEEQANNIIPINPIIVNYEEDVDVMIVERRNISENTWGSLINDEITWQKAKDEYIW